MQKYPTDPTLAAELLEFRQHQGITNAELGRRFGVSPTFISEYINDRLQRDPRDFDARARNILAALKARLEDATNLFETSVTRNIAGRIDMARRTQDVMLLVGPAGEGKTCGAKLFATANPGTIYLELASYQRTGSKVAGALYDKLERRNDWKGNTSRAEFVTLQLRGSHRVIIIDEAHLLDATGRQFLFNLNRDTGCAVVLIGNPEILDKIRRNDQHFSRVGVKGQPLLTDKELPAVSYKVAEQFSSTEFADQIADLVSFIAGKPGRLRSVRKTVILAYELAQKNGSDARKSVREAHRNLVRDYALPSD
jgi:DNA transposition AAA+ family ATPase